MKRLIAAETSNEGRMQESSKEPPLLPTAEYFSGLSSPEHFLIQRLEEALRLNRPHQRLHRHDFYQVWLLGRGNVVFTIDFLELPIRAPALVFAPPGCVHLFTRLREPGGFMLSFGEEFLHNQDLPKSALKECVCFDPASRDRHIPLQRADFPRIRRLWGRMMDEFRSRRPRFQTILAIKLWEFLVEVQRLSHQTLRGGKPPRSALTLRFLDLLNDGAGRWQSASQIAASLRVSRSWLNQLVRQETGLSLTEHIQNRVLLEAKRLLAQSDFNVSEVAFQLGFEDPAYFGRLFRQRETITPLEFRHRFRLTLPEMHPVA